MFDQKDVEAYRRIKAPEELREQVMRLEKKPGADTHQNEMDFVWISGRCACAAVSLMPALPPFAVRGETALLYQGVPIGAEPVSIPADHPQMTSGTSGSLRRNSSGAGNRRNDPGICFPAVNSACLIRRGELLGDGTEAEISEDVLLYWDLSGTEDTMFSLTLKTNGKQLTYVLSMRDDGGYDLQQNQSPK